MEQNVKRARLPIFGMVLTALLVLGGLYGLHWWTENRGDIYTQRALAAGWQEDWDQAESWARKAEANGASGVLDKLTYDRAAALFEAGDYAAARQLYRELGTYREAARQIMACDYKTAEALEAAGDYAAARDAFLAVAGYEDALNRADRCRYAIAEQILASGDAEAAFQAFLALGNFQDAPQRAQALAQELTGEEDAQQAVQSAQGCTLEALSLQEQLDTARGTLQNHRLAAGQGHALFLTEAGTVQAAGNNDRGQCDTSSWTNVVAVAAGYAHSLGLTADGRVLAVGDNSCGQCDTAAWTNVVRIVCGPWDSFGLTADGSLLHCGFGDASAAAGWTGLSAVAPGDGVLFALRQNGTLLSTRPAGTETWLDLCGLAAAGYAPVGLKKDGTVLSPTRDLSAWTDVVSLHSSAALLVGLRLDGTLLVEPLLPADASLLAALRAETDMAGLALAGTYALLLHADGTLSAPGAPFDVRSFSH